MTPPLVGDVFTDPATGRVWNLTTGIRTDADGSTHPEAGWSTAEKAKAALWRKTMAREKLKVDLAAGIEALKDARTAAQTIAGTNFNAAPAYSEAQMQGLADAVLALAGNTAIALTASVRLAQVATELVD